MSYICITCHFLVFREPDLMENLEMRHSLITFHLLSRSHSGELLILSYSFLLNLIINLEKWIAKLVIQLLDCAGLVSSNVCTIYLHQSRY